MPKATNNRSANASNHHQSTTPTSTTGTATTTTITTATEISQDSIQITLALASAAFKDADFFEASVLFWSAALDTAQFLKSQPKEIGDLFLLAMDYNDLEDQLGIDIQDQKSEVFIRIPKNVDWSILDPHQEPRSEIFQKSSSKGKQQTTLAPLYEFIVTALVYLTRQINIRIDVLPGGGSILTLVGPPQRYFGTLDKSLQELYHALLAVVFESVSMFSMDATTMSTEIPQIVPGNEPNSLWQVVLDPQSTKKPHQLPRNFSFLNPASGSVAGMSMPRNEQDILGLQKLGVRLVVTLMAEAPLKNAWFESANDTGEDGKVENSQGNRIRVAYAPIENMKAVAQPAALETILGWCVQLQQPQEASSSSSSSVPPPHQNAVLIHCGGGKGRAGLVLAAYLIRFGLGGHEQWGYCKKCRASGNVHSRDLVQFKHLGVGGSLTNPVPDLIQVPTACKSQESNDEDGSDDSDEEDENDNGRVRKKCISTYTPQMTASHAMQVLRSLRPGSIESKEQEKCVKEYGDWLWKMSSKEPSSKKSRKSATLSADSQDPQQQSREDVSVESTPPTTTTTTAASSPKQKSKGGKKNNSNNNNHSAVASSPVPDVDDFPSDDEYDRRGKKTGGGGGGKKRGKLVIEPAFQFTPPPAHQIIKIPGSGKGSHHQHHLVVQHNLRARQLQLQRGPQRGQKSGKKNGGKNKLPKERSSFKVSGVPLENGAPKLVILTGFPGSGKSYFVQQLLDSYPDHFIRISQDEVGTRAVCERLLAQGMRQQQQALGKSGLPMTIILDRCNPMAAERKEWYEVAFQADETAMIWFSLDVDQCIERVDSRENHPTVHAGMGSKVVRGFAKSYEVPNLQSENWCKTLVEIGDDEGSDKLVEIFKDLAEKVRPANYARQRGNVAPVAVAKRPVFIPSKVRQRKEAASGAGSGGEESVSGVSSPDVSKPVKVEEATRSKAKSKAGDDDDDDEEGSEEEEEDEEEEEEEELETEDEDEDKDEKDGDDSDQDDDGEHGSGSDKNRDDNDSEDFGDEPPVRNFASTPPSAPVLAASKFASPTGHRPVVKRPQRQSGKNGNDTMGKNCASGSKKDVQFSTPLARFDRPLQKFPRTPHLFDPLTVDCTSNRDGGRKLSEQQKSGAITRDDLLLPSSVLSQWLVHRKANQVLTIEEKVDGANIGLSVVHFKPSPFASKSATAAVPPPKIRVQNRNHWVHPEDHWQYKKMAGWLERSREDILYLCEGRWRKESNKPKGQGTDKDQEDEKSGNDDDDDGHGEEDEEEEEYVDETHILQDGMAPFVLYGEWVYAKHSVHYTNLEAYFIPFDLLDVKTGRFLSRKVFWQAVAQTEFKPIPEIKIPLLLQDAVNQNNLKEEDKVCKMVDWVLETLQRTSAFMKSRSGDEIKDDDDEDEDEDVKRNQRLEGLYFRIDQGDHLLMRSKVVRHDFLEAGQERWGVEEQVVNKIGYTKDY